MVPALFSTLHILALVVGLPSIWFRGRALRRGDVPAILQADAGWGVAAVLWMVTGLTRVFYTEKGAAWYNQQPLFWLKMGLFGLVWLLELWPMITFILWRIKRAKKEELDMSKLPMLARINDLEVALTLTLPFVASMMARAVF